MTKKIVQILFIACLSAISIGCTSKSVDDFIMGEACRPDNIYCEGEYKKYEKEKSGRIRDTHYEDNMSF